MNSPNPDKKKATVERWYLRPAVWVTAALCLGSATYAVIMSMQQKEYQAVRSQLKLDIETQCEKTRLTMNRRMEVKVNPLYRKHLLERHQNNISSMEERITNANASVEKLNALDSVKEYRENARQLRELKEKNQSLYQQVEKKKQRYRTLRKEAQS